MHVNRYTKLHTSEDSENFTILNSIALASSALGQIAYPIGE
jgi:hypothetical protein